MQIKGRQDDLLLLPEKYIDAFSWSTTDIFWFPFLVDGS